MKDWIEKNLDPPGMGRKNWRSLFSFIGRVFGIVKDDAVKAHNAFFPYLCDADKLRQHGDVLMIPELPFDTEADYRDRVATASFYLMRAGERAYIHEQLRARFGDAYLLTEEFLQVLIEIADLSEEGKAWVYGFLDGILDPNISFKITGLLREYAEAFCGAVIKADGTVHLQAAENDANAIFAAIPAVKKTVNMTAAENDAVSCVAVVPRIKCCISFFAGEV